MPQELDDQGNPLPPTPISPTPPIDPPPAGPNREEYERLQRQNDLATQVMREQNRTIAELNSKLSAAPSAPVAPPKSAEEIRAEYYADPITANRQLIKEELEKSVGPLREFVSGLRVTSQLDEFVNRAKADPRFSSQWDPAVEQMVRSQAATANPLTQQVFDVVCFAVIGMKAAGSLPGSTPPTPPKPPVPPTPPYIPPSNGLPPAPPRPTGAVRELNEYEKRLAREYRMTDDEFRAWLDEDPTKVATSKIGKP